ncbi:phosphoribosylformylglycinamidine cyclo-ligase [Elusimicrobiota bacterium]
MDKYKESGVNIEKAEGLVNALKEKFPEIGGYAGKFQLGENKLAATCDGVGTKIKLAIEFNKHREVGQDLVAMSVNDLIAGGSKPLFFLDYFSCGKLDETVFNEVLSGIEIGIKKAGCLLLGGETAEMPGIYKDADYDLAGFACGIVLKEFDKSSVRKGDLIAGIRSSGLHSNGFSLVRKTFSEDELSQHRDMIMRPTRIYSEFTEDDRHKEIFVSDIKSMAHVTGGGIKRALARLLPSGSTAALEDLELTDIFEVMQAKGISRDEMSGVFNMGWGMLFVIDESRSEILDTIDAQVIGRVI